MDRDSVQGVGRREEREGTVMSALRDETTIIRLERI